MSPNFHKTYRKAQEAIREFAALGVSIEEPGTSPTTSAGVLLSQMGRASRAFDGDPDRSRSRTFDRDHREPLGEADAYACDDDDLSGLRERLDNALSTPNLSPGRAKRLQRLSALLDDLLQRGDEEEMTDSDRAQGGAHRDMEADGNRPYAALEDGATGEIGRHLRRSRALSRVADAATPLHFHGGHAAQGSDLERVERQALESFNLY
jgi:hypothetical protein